MPLLEHRRQPCTVVARIQEYLKDKGLSLPLGELELPWPLTWGILHLGGTVLGAGVADRHTELLTLPHVLSPENLTRLSGALILAFFLFPARKSGYIWAGVCLLGLAAGFTEADGRLARKSVRAPEPISPAQAVVCRGAGAFRLTSWPGAATRGKWKASAVLLEWKKPNAAATCSDPGPGQGVMLSGQGTPPVPGQIVQGVATLRVPRGADLPGSFDYREFLAGRGLHWQGQLEETPVSGELTGPGSLLVEYLGSARTWVRRGLERLLPAREAELSGAVLLGTRTAGSRQGAEPFADLGLAHLFAVSGLHVGILLGIVVLPGRALGLSATWRFLPLLFFLPVYAALTGLPGSVVRAAGLALLAGGAGALGRRGNSLHLLGLLFWGTTLWHPAQVLDTGVRLSYLAAGGIITVMGLLRPVISGGGRWSWLVTALAVSLAAQWFTLPQAAMSFGRFSVLSPAANLVAVPLFGLGVWAVVLALIIGTAVPWLAQSVAALGWLVLRGLSGVVALVSGGTGGLNLGLAPTSVINGLFWVLLTVTLLGMLRRLSNGEGQARLRSLAVILGILVLGHGVFAWNGFMLAGNGTMRVWQFDVGQGDCALVVFPDRWTCLVDAGGVFGRGMGPPDGPVRRSVIPYLKRAWVKKLDAVVLGHGHLDHTGGVPSLQEEMTIGHWWTGGDAARDVAGIIPEGRTTIVEKPVILHRQGPWTLEILYPAEGLPADFHENDRSLVMVLRHGDRPCMVWSGDLETHGERHLLETMADLPEKTQVWKAGHHGSNTSGSRNWLDRLDPGLVIISCGAGNKYGHPNHGWYTIEQDTLPTLRTDLEGSILLEWDSEGSLRWVSRALEGHLAALP